MTRSATHWQARTALTLALRDAYTDELSGLFDRVAAIRWDDAAQERVIHAWLAAKRLDWPWLAARLAAVAARAHDGADWRNKHEAWRDSQWADGDLAGPQGAHLTEDALLAECRAPHRNREAIAALSAERNALFAEAHATGMTDGWHHRLFITGTAGAALRARLAILEQRRLALNRATAAEITRRRPLQPIEAVTQHETLRQFVARAKQHYSDRVAFFRKHGYPSAHARPELRRDAAWYLDRRRGVPYARIARAAPPTAAADAVKHAVERFAIILGVEKPRSTKQDK